MTTNECIVEINRPNCNCEITLDCSEFEGVQPIEAMTNQDFDLILLNLLELLSRGIVVEWRYLIRFNATGSLRMRSEYSITDDECIDLCTCMTEVVCVWFYSQLHNRCNFATWQYEYDHLISLENSSNSSIWQIQSTWMAICDYNYIKEKYSNKKKRKRSIPEQIEWTI